MNKSKCPICKRKFQDILKHFVLSHGIKDMNHLVEEVEKAQREENKTAEFRNYVNDLNNKKREGKISAKDYRELVMRWFKEHNEG